VAPAVQGAAQQVQEQGFAGVVRPALQSLEQHGEQWLTSVLISGLSALLAGTTRAAIQQRAEQGLHALVQKLVEVFPDGAVDDQTRAKTERTLQVILSDALDAIFNEARASALHPDDHQAIQRSQHGDVGGALNKLEDTLKAIVAALGAVLQKHRQTVLRLALALALLALESSLIESGNGQKQSAPAGGQA
jgi:hypothetical protein